VFWCRTFEGPMHNDSAVWNESAKSRVLVRRPDRGSLAPREICAAQRWKPTTIATNHVVADIRKLLAFDVNRLFKLLVQPPAQLG